MTPQGERRGWILRARLFEVGVGVGFSGWIALWREDGVGFSLRDTSRRGVGDGIICERGCEGGGLGGFDARSLKAGGWG